MAQNAAATDATSESFHTGPTPRPTEWHKHPATHMAMTTPQSIQAMTLGGQAQGTDANTAESKLPQGS